MRYFAGIIRSKPSWWENIHDPVTVKKWRDEMVEHDRVTHDELWGGDLRFKLYKKKANDGERGRRRGDVKWWPRELLTEAQIKYIFDELLHAASKRDPSTGVFTSHIQMAFESHSLVDGALKTRLARAVVALEDLPDDQKVWHPKFNNQVLDLVHPSMYPLCIGHTYFRVPNPKGGEPVLTLLDRKKYLQVQPASNSYNPRYSASDAYQWLPTDFAVSLNGDVTTAGYINNAHPSRHRALYPVVTSIVVRFVPMFERMISSTLNMQRPVDYIAIEVDGHEWYNHLEVKEPEDDDDDNTYKDRHAEWERLHKWPRIPDPKLFTPLPTDARTEFSLKGRTIQVIVKLTNVHLTPDNPFYPGGSWHVEGMGNERIVATGLYCYTMENVTESGLAFRHCVGSGESGSELMYQQGDRKGYTTAFGFACDDPFSQPLGHIVAAEGKCVAYPNFYQHRVEPFELADKTRPGHIKILSLFLVDPTTRILSTSDVPPQQREWAIAQAEQVPALQKLPRELYDMVVGYAEEGLMSRAQAEEHRGRLMKEQAAFTETYNEESFEQLFCGVENNDDY
ncbi:uncharacterized protein BXZ73DRAFT_43212 [Epithele typhae]|uniref:uncharacterized protein n=1 Tax=Epithele typhae TaxID=378194 RepID=UPI002007516D|nr:uncharacterized protein BXZ73DRAFT_43212 [Epithele typhae]KAH9940059.1 hypothetical protein BXZ73DRAFT_43212 [Epithele typhae]